MTFALLLAAALHADTTTAKDTTWFVTNRAPIGTAFGGGGLMDIGCYCISLARFIYEAEKQDC